MAYKKNEIDFVDEDLKDVGFFYIFARFVLPILVWLVVAGIAIGGAGYFIWFLANNPVSWA